MAEHYMSWDGRYGRAYLIRCSCGWTGSTFAETPGTSVQATWEAHLPPITPMRSTADGDDR